MSSSRATVHGPAPVAGDHTGGGGAPARDPDPRDAARALVARAQRRRAERAARAREARARLPRLAAICAEEGARRVMLFGSVADGAWHAVDIDLAVEGLPDDRYLPLLDRLLDEADPFAVDLVVLETAPPSLRTVALAGEVLHDGR